MRLEAAALLTTVIYSAWVVGSTRSNGIVKVLFNDADAPTAHVVVVFEGFSEHVGNEALIEFQRDAFAHGLSLTFNLLMGCYSLSSEVRVK
jgi:hypothetical protein